MLSSLVALAAPNARFIAPCMYCACASDSRVQFDLPGSPHLQDRVLSFFPGIMHGDLVMTCTPDSRARNPFGDDIGLAQGGWGVGAESRCRGAATLNGGRPHAA